MLIKVIHTDGSTGTVRDSSLWPLLKMGGIAAYQGSDGWVEVRRKQLSVNYRGPERRQFNRTPANSL